MSGTLSYTRLTKRTFSYSFGAIGFDPWSWVTLNNVGVSPLINVPGVRLTIEMPMRHRV